jgi:hypothetical protein
MRISTADLIRHFGKYSDDALHEPIIITRKGRDRLVLLSIDEYRFLCEGAIERDAAPGEPDTASTKADEDVRVAQSSAARTGRR